MILNMTTCVCAYAGSGPAAESGFLSRMSGTDLVKYMVIGMIIVLSVRVLPYIGAKDPAVRTARDSMHAALVRRVS